MTKNRHRGWAAVALACGLAAPAVAAGQVTPMPASRTGAAPPAAPPAMLSNPMMSPAFNPYLNPMAGPAQDPAMARDAAFLYLLSRQAQGGIGSGLMANNPGAGRRAATTNRAPTQIAPAAMVPGSGASRYFNSGQGAANHMNDFYGRRERIAPPARR
ncbi:hypothetical protein TA3x_004976 [Tundrisphaera sp. TA3]|uniref:hypothetical protein n=1 Tax=Tundrisphaera sp. TA3 TaxID=3435775 RepID=UPI003EBACB53